MNGSPVDHPSDVSRQFWLGGAGGGYIDIYSITKRELPMINYDQQNEVHVEIWSISTFHARFSTSRPTFYIS